MRISDIARVSQGLKANSGNLQGPLTVREGSVSENDRLNGRRRRVPVPRYIVMIT